MRRNVKDVGLSKKKNNNNNKQLLPQLLERTHMPLNKDLRL
jgi:hypothetical protein